MDSTQYSPESSLVVFEVDNIQSQVSDSDTYTSLVVFSPQFASPSVDDVSASCKSMSPLQFDEFGQLTTLPLMIKP